MSTAIRVNQLRKVFRRNVRKPGATAALRALFNPQSEEIVAVSDVSFDIQAGEKVAFIGPNGAGKSTTIKMLTGILHPTSGHAEVLGLEPWRDRERLVSRLGCVFGQRSQLWYHLPVAETFEMLTKVYDLDVRRGQERLAELVELFELEALLPQPVRKLSLGQRMRCEIAASLLHRPDAVFLDEPTIGLDVAARERVRGLLRRLNDEEGVTLFLTSHDAGDIEAVCDRVILIDEGRVVLDTSVEELKREHIRSKRIEAVIEQEQLELELPGVELLPAQKHRFIARVNTALTPVDEVVQAIVATAQVRDLTIAEPRLESVIASLYEGET